MHQALKKLSAYKESTSEFIRPGSNNNLNYSKTNPLSLNFIYTLIISSFGFVEGITRFRKTVTLINICLLQIANYCNSNGHYLCHIQPLAIHISYPKQLAPLPHPNFDHTMSWGQSKKPQKLWSTKHTYTREAPRRHACFAMKAPVLQNYIISSLTSHAYQAWTNLYE